MKTPAVTVEEFKAKQRHVLLDGIAHLPLDVAYIDEGAGEVIVLLHGIPTWSFLYREVIPLLADRCRVIAIDFLGHGYSDRRDCFDRSLPVQAKMVQRLLLHLHVSEPTVVGHDTGGGVGLILAIEKLISLKKLVLSNIVVYDSWPAEDMIALGNPFWKAKSGQEIGDFLREGLRQGVYRSERRTDEFVEGIVAPYLDDVGRISLIRNASALNTNHTTALVDRHHTVECPTLLLWGNEDPWQTVRDAERLARELQNATPERQYSSSHWLQQDDPVAYSKSILRFIDSHE